MAAPSKRFAVFLCLIVLHQDLIIARTHHNELLVVASSQFRHQMDTNDFEEDFVDNSLALLQTNNNVTISSSDPLQRSKRLLGTFIFVLSMVVTLAATTIETIYDIGRCCGLGYDYLCSFESKFNRRKDDLKKRTENIDKRLKAALTKRDNLECLAKVLETLWTEIEKLVTLQEEVLVEITPQLLNKVLTIDSEIKTKVGAITGDIDKNDINELISKMSETDLAIQLSTQWSAFAIPGLGAFAKGALKAFKINRIYKSLKATQLEPLLKASPKAQKLLGFSDDAAKVFLKNTALARFGSKSSTLMKGMKFLKVAGNVVSVLSIAIDLFSMINTFVDCDQKSEKAETAMAQLVKAETNVTDTENSIKEFEDLLKTDLEDKLLAHVRNSQLHNAMEITKDIIKKLPVGQRSWSIKNCVDSIIPDTLKLMNTSKDYVLIKDEIISMIDNCMATLKYSYECVILRVQVRNHILEGCQAGTAEFDELYKQGITKQLTTIKKCVINGEPYTRKEDYRKTLEEFSSKSNFSIPCRLNNAAFKNDVCSKYNNKKTAEEIAQVVKMSLSHVQMIIEKCKQGEDYLNPAQISKICIFKILCKKSEDIVGFMVKVYGKHISVEQVKKLPCSGGKNPKCPTLFD